MAAPSGHWRVIANGFQGNLDIQVDPHGNVTGTIEIDVPHVEQVHGLWDEAEQRIIFQRPVAVAGGSPQNYTGVEFPASAPLFQDGSSALQRTRRTSACWREPSTRSVRAGPERARSSDGVARQNF